EYVHQFYQDNLPGITLDEVNALAAQYYTDTNRDILIMAPEKLKDSLPDEATVLKWMDEVSSSTMEAYEDTVSDQPLLSQEPTPGKVVSEKEIKGLDAKELTLSNGVKVVLKSTD